MHSLRIRPHNQILSTRTKRHTRDPRGITPPPKLKEFFALGDGKDADDGAFVGGGGEEVAFGGEGEEGYGGFVGGDNVYGGEGEGVEEEDFACVLEGGGWG
jgi:hypothetical protein